MLTLAPRALCCLSRLIQCKSLCRETELQYNTVGWPVRTCFSLLCTVRRRAWRHVAKWRIYTHSSLGGGSDNTTWWWLAWWWFGSPITGPEVQPRSISTVMYSSSLARMKCRSALTPCFLGTWSRLCHPCDHARHHWISSVLNAWTMCWRPRNSSHVKSSTPPCDSGSPPAVLWPPSLDLSVKGPGVLVGRHQLRLLRWRIPYYPYNLGVLRRFPPG